jgi:hypothetical protein
MLKCVITPAGWTSKAPMSMPAPTTRAKLGPRWS